MPIITFEDQRPPAKIVVIGIGGAGSNSINHMVRNEIRGVKLVAVNTDIQSLRISDTPNKFELGTISEIGNRLGTVLHAPGAHPWRMKMLFLRRLHGRRSLFL